MFAIEVDLCALTEYLFKIIQTADIDGITVGIHPGPAEYVNPAGAAKEVTRFS
jgi:hypothetical protein